jgi:hypothetical protein
MKKFQLIALAALATFALGGCSTVLTHERETHSFVVKPQSGVGLLPDLQTVVPQQLQVVNKQKKESLRFSNSVANTGAGHLRMRAEFPLSDPSEPQLGIQEILDADGNIVDSQVVSEFEFHPAHHHWHIDAVALFEIRAGSPDGPVVGANQIKTTFCLIDWVKLDGNSPNNERTYSECFGQYQGISPGWADQYHQSLEGQELDLTGVAPGLYYMVSTANPEHHFIESDYTNNAAWVAFNLTRDSNGNAKIAIVGNSPCAGTMCGFSQNR